MAAVLAFVHHRHMAGRTTNKHFLREWRQHRGYSLERVAEAVGMTHASLSRIERGLQQPRDELLVLLADYYQTEPASLRMRDPTEPDSLWTIYDQLTPVQRRQVTEIAKTILRTGTDE